MVAQRCIGPCTCGARLRLRPKTRASSTLAIRSSAPRPIISTALPPSRSVRSQSSIPHDGASHLHEHDSRFIEMTSVPLPHSVSFRKRPDAKRQATWSLGSWFIWVAVQGCYPTLASPTRPAAYNCPVST
ncbi:hypothetical protein CUC08_Gglean010405 [Alternaria sp. MG1]|nr:hypothetical protein CUC08_Gglean010405 [Alternaria sp. MG1]